MSMILPPHFNAMRASPAYQARREVRGFTLLEVMISVVILAIGMLGIAALLITTQKSNSSSYIKQQAVQSAYNILDRMRANQQEAISGAYNVNNLAAAGATPVAPGTPATDCSVVACSPTQMATYDTWHWLAKDLPQMTNGCGSVVTSAAGANTLVTVTVQWDDSPASKTLGSSVATQPAGSTLAKYSIQTLL